MFVIGAGSGGVRTARVAAGTYGSKVAVCELPFAFISSDTAGGAGGTCVLRGCVPKKLFVYASEFAEHFKDAVGFGWEESKVSLDWGAFLAKKNAELVRLNGIYSNLLKNSGVEFIEGRGRLVDPHTVEVDGKQYMARHIVVATGGRAFVPTFPGSEHTIISDNVLELQEIPKRMVVMGGGYIGLEFAGVFANLGTEVHVFYRGELPLTGFDEEVRNFVTEQYKVNGLHLHPHNTPARVDKHEDGSLTFFAKDSKTGEVGEWQVDTVVMATGRKPNTHNLGLEEVGVQLNKQGAIVVDQYSQSTVPSIWAVGDVTDRKNLTPVALMEGMALTKTICAGQPTAPDHTYVASAVFSHPQIATVGFTEEQAVKEFGDVDVYTSSFRPMKNTISGNPGRTFMKLVVDAGSQRVVGAHMAGPDAAEVMQGLAVAVKIGVTKEQLDGVVGIHPSAAEEFVTMRSVARQLRREKVAAAA